MKVPAVRYVQTADGTFIAFQVFGHGDRDIVCVPGFISNVLLNWEMPGMVRMFERLSRFARVVVMDHRGTGLSDRLPVGKVPPLETQMDDLGAVMDAAQIRVAHLYGDEDGAALCALFAASYPDRVASLSLYAIIPHMWSTPEFPFGPTEGEWKDRMEARLALWARGWGLEAARDDYEYAAPSVASDEAEVARWARYLMLSGSPGSVTALMRLWAETDTRSILPYVRVPTLVLARRDTPRDHPAIARWVASTIPDARCVELPGRDIAHWIGDVDSLADAIEGFVTGAPPLDSHDRELSTVMFTDIV